MTSISLGWRCSSAEHGVKYGMRKLKSQGYKTCPFDLMITNYDGLIQCLYDDFKYFCDLDSLKIVHFPQTDKAHSNDRIIVNTKYNFMFSHESPGHADIYIGEKWNGGINHFVSNDYELFRKRYLARIQNFRNYINSGEKITFIICKIDPDVSKLNTCLKTLYPQLDFEILFLQENDLQWFNVIHNQMNSISSQKKSSN